MNADSLSDIQNKALWTSEDFCSVMNWKPKTLYMKVTRGAPLPASIKVGNKRYFRKEVVMQWLLAQEEATSIH